MTPSRANSSSNLQKGEVGPIMILTPCHNSHDFSERRIVVSKSEEHAVKIGRAVGRVLAASNNAIFDCKVLSRNHAIVWAEDDMFLIKDTKSSNGTFINNTRLSNSGEESAATTLSTGDILQLGVEIVDNTKKVASGCIVAMVRFLNENGEEIPPLQSMMNGLNMHSNPLIERVPKHCLVVPEEQMYQMQQYIQEAKHRESTLKQKLLLLNDALRTAQVATESNWEAMINEDRLLARIEVLEDQLTLCANKNLTPEELKQQINDYFEQRKKVETMTKDLLRQTNQDASEARQRLHEAELAILNVEEQNSVLKKEVNDLHKVINDLKYELAKLTADYDVVCHELELSKATNVLLVAKNQRQQQENGSKRGSITADVEENTVAEDLHRKHSQKEENVDKVQNNEVANENKSQDEIKDEKVDVAVNTSDLKIENNVSVVEKDLSNISLFNGNIQNDESLPIERIKQPSVDDKEGLFSIFPLFTLLILLINMIKEQVYLPAKKYIMPSGKSPPEDEAGSCIKND
uniref:FHA domain-containing protein n=1 Tax=Panagrolaimus sp. JU765 TaxID=591449 RepID=A0AC34R007_9BILA